MVSIRLPDGSSRSYDHPVTVAEVAASIGPGLAKAAVAGRVDGKAGRHVPPHRAGRRAGDRHGPGRRRPRGAAPLDGAPARVRGEGALPRCAGDHRAGHRQRLLLRLRLQARLHARGPRSDREEDGRTGEEGRAGRSRSVEARRRREVLRIDRRAVQGRDHRVDPGQRGHLAVPRGGIHRPVPRPARAVDGQAQGLQADEGRRRLLARRPATTSSCSASTARPGAGRKTRTRT